MANQEMFQKVHAVLTKFPELHHQPTWEAPAEDTGLCGTTRCVAGWAVWLKAEELGLISRKRDLMDDVMLVQVGQHLGLRVDPDEVGVGAVYTKLGAELLGLNDDAAYSLFQDFNKPRVTARVKSYAETGEDLSDKEYDLH